MSPKERAFKDWWEDGEPIAGITKKLAKEIFLDGYAMGSRQPVYQMTESQYKLLVRMIGEKIRAEEREACANVALTGSGEAVQLKTLEIIRTERERIADAIRSRA